MQNILKSLRKKLSKTAVNRLLIFLEKSFALILIKEWLSHKSESTLYSQSIFLMVPAKAKKYTIQDLKIFLLKVRKKTGIINQGLFKKKGDQIRDYTCKPSMIKFHFSLILRNNWMLANLLVLLWGKV